MAGLRKESDSKYTADLESKRKIRKIQRMCRKKHLRFCYDNEYGHRNQSYRKSFFENNAPHVMGRYFCAYCGKLLPQKKVTIDHLYPVHVVSQNLKMQARLWRKGIGNINSPENLVAACFSCNRRKSARTGKWILRGRLGRHKSYWVARWMLRVILFIMLVIVAHRAMSDPLFLPGVFSRAQNIEERWIRNIAGRVYALLSTTLFL